MFDATTRYIPENDAIDWHALADELFPADALLTVPAAKPLTVFRYSA
jgi:hypothetical protein